MSAEKLVLEADSIEDGIVTLVSKNRIGELVMGAAADNKYKKYDCCNRLLVFYFCFLNMLISLNPNTVAIHFEKKQTCDVISRH